MPNFYARAEGVTKLIKDPLALKILLELYPSKKFNSKKFAEDFKLSHSAVMASFIELEKNSMIADNPSSGNKILTEEGRFFLEQTATVFPKLKRFLEEKENIYIPPLV